MDEEELYKLIEGQKVTFNRDIFMTQRDRRMNDDGYYSRKSEIIKDGEVIAVVHAHVEDENVITKAHVKTSDFGDRLFDLEPLSTRSGYILSFAFSSTYRVKLS